MQLFHSAIANSRFWIKDCVSEADTFTDAFDQKHVFFRLAMNEARLGELKDFQRFSLDVIISEANAFNRELDSECAKLKSESEQYRWGMGRLLSLMIALLVNPERSVLKHSCVSTLGWPAMQISSVFEKTCICF